LLHAARHISDTTGADLDKETLEEIIVRAQSWIVKRLQGTGLDYTQLAERLISEGIIAVLVYVAAKIGCVPVPSNHLSPFGSSIEQHFRASGFAAPGIEQTQEASQDEQNEQNACGTSPGDHSISPANTTYEDAPLSPIEEGKSGNMASPTIDRFLGGLAQVANSGNGEELASWLPIEPPFNLTYADVIQEMRSRFPSKSKFGVKAPLSDTDEIVLKAKSLLSSVQTSTGDDWSNFSQFVAQYLCFIRDVDPSNLLDTYDKLTDLMTRCNTSLSTPDVGVIMLPTTVAYAKVFARLAIGLEKQPELIAHLVEAPTDEGGESLSLPERAGNTIRSGFIACLNEIAQYPPNQPAKPVGRHVGIYKLANICLKIFFQCKKTKSAEQIFLNIGAKSPPINIYPRSERVTYLYYLGRFYFSVNHFYRAQAVLQAAYNDCHVQARSQRRLILIYLATSNMILGRFPSEAIYSKPEAQGFRERFQPLCDAIRKGDLPTFRRLTDMTTEHADWFIFHRIFLQIRSRCEVLVWRSLSRRVWLINGDRGNPETRRPPFLELDDLVTISHYLEQRALNPLSLSDGGPGNRHTNWVFMSQTPPNEARYIDPDFEGLSDDDEYFDEDGFDNADQNPFLLPGLPEIESMVSSLVSQGLVNGYVSTQKKLAIQGAQKKAASEAGWPNVWQTIRARCEAGGTEIPGWKRGGSAGGGRVVNLSGAKPVGL
jgi:hypothetical protein